MLHGFFNLCNLFIVFRLAFINIGFEGIMDSLFFWRWVRVVIVDVRGSSRVIKYLLVIIIGYSSKRRLAIDHVIWVLLRVLLKWLRVFLKWIMVVGR